MDRTTFYRNRAHHFRQLAELTWQEELETMLRDLAEQYDEMARTSRETPKMGTQSTTSAATLARCDEQGYTSCACNPDCA
jgi:hypothetical protein